MACWGGREVSQEQRSAVGQAKQRAGDGRTCGQTRCTRPRRRRHNGIRDTPGAGAGVFAISQRLLWGGGIGKKEMRCEIEMVCLLATLPPDMKSLRKGQWMPQRESAGNLLVGKHSDITGERGHGKVRWARCHCPIVPFPHLQGNVLSSTPCGDGAGCTASKPPPLQPCPRPSSLSAL